MKKYQNLNSIKKKKLRIVSILPFDMLKTKIDLSKNIRFEVLQNIPVSGSILIFWDLDYCTTNVCFIIRVILN